MAKDKGKERKQDLGGPEEEALEQRVHDMMDLAAPDEPTPSPKAKDAKTVTIVVSHADDEPVVETEKPTEEPPTPDPELAAAIATANQELSQQASTAPLLGETPKVTAKSIPIEHDTSEPEPPVVEIPAEPEISEQPDQQPAAEATEPVVEAAEETPAVDPTTTVGELMEQSPLEEAIESTETEKAVSDIVATESDELLAINDLPHTPTTKKPRKKRRNILRTSWGRWAIFLLLLGGLGAVFATPTWRYAALNKAGVRSSASITVTDQSTLRPLKNVTVTLAGQSVQTDAEGKAQLQQLRLGPTHLVVEKRAFGTVEQAVTVGWGSNPLADVSLKSTGSQYAFVITDALSGKPVANAEASVDEASATSNDKGEISLAVPQTELSKLTITIKAGGYRSEAVDLDLATKQATAVKLVSDRPVAFISKRTGTYGVYRTDIDGKNESLVLAGTGSETTTMSLAQHPSANVAVLVSTRAGGHDKAGKLLQTLTLINLDTKATKPVADSVDIRLIDWVGSRLVYVQQVRDAASDSPARYQLMSYDYLSGDNRQLAAANYFNDVVSAGGKVYYAPAGAQQNGINIGVFVVYADGSSKQPLLAQEAWSIYRVSYEQLVLAVKQDWYGYTLGDKAPQKLSGQPSNTVSRLYTDSPDGKHSIWVDDRDGKGTIVSYEAASKNGTTLYSAAGVRGPIRWLNNTTIVFRTSTGQETSDYVLSIDGGAPKKVTDVTNVPGITRWSL